MTKVKKKSHKTTNKSTKKSTKTVKSTKNSSAYNKKRKNTILSGGGRGIDSLGIYGINNNSSDSESSDSESSTEEKGLTVRERPSEIYIAPSTFSVQRAGVEIYLTDEDNFTPYVSPNNNLASKNNREAEVANEDAEDSSDEEESESINNEAPASAYTLHQGEIIETSYYTDLTNMSFESDYEDMSSSGSLNRRDFNLKQFYKGKRLKLLTAWEEPNETLEWSDLEDALIGFITEQTFKDVETEVKVSGWETLLEQTLAFDFKSMFRADIIKEILKSAGFNPIINVEGLDNDIMDFTNEVKTGGGGTDSSAPIGKVSGNIAKLAKQICAGKTNALGKAQAIHTYIANNIRYPPEPIYEDHKRCPEEVIRRGESNCCDRARLGHEMANAVGLRNKGVHGTGSCGHVWIQYNINGKWVNSDPNYSRPNLGKVYEDMAVDRGWTFEEC